MSLFTFFMILFYGFSIYAFPKPDYTKNPILMVHGYFLPGNTSWSALKKRLTEEGWPAEYLYIQKFKNVVGCNPEHGNEIKATVEKIIAETGKNKIDVITHSMGAVDILYYIKYLCGYQHIQNVVNVSGAVHGTKVACLDLISCGAKEMCISSGDKWQENDFLAKLNACDETPVDSIKYTVIWSTFDEIINPPSGSQMKGAWNIKTSIFPTEHGLILLNTKVHDYIIEALNGAGKNDNPSPADWHECVTVCSEDKPDNDSEPMSEITYSDITENDTIDTSEDMFQQNDNINKDTQNQANKKTLSAKANYKLHGKFHAAPISSSSSNVVSNNSEKVITSGSCSLITFTHYSDNKIQFLILFMLLLYFLFGPKFIG